MDHRFKAIVLGTWAAVVTTVLSAAEAPGASVPAAVPKPHIVHEPYGDLGIVVPLTTDDKAIQGQKLRNVANALRAADEWHGNVTVKVVMYAKGLTLLRDPDEATRSKLDALRSHHVQFVVCGNTLQEQGIDYHTLYGVQESDIVPSGFAEVAFLQARKHYVIDTVN